MACTGTSCNMLLLSSISVSMGKPIKLSGGTSIIRHDSRCLKWQQEHDITVTSNEHSGIYNHCQLDCFVIFYSLFSLTHWGRATHICVGKLTIIGSDNGLSPGRRQTIIWTIAGILLIGPVQTKFSEILIKIQTFLLKKIRLKMSSAKCCWFRLGLNVLRVNVNIKIPTLIVLYDRNPPVIWRFPSQRASNAGNVSISWWYHEINEVST